MDDPKPPRSRLRGWWALAIAITATLLATVALGWWWYLSTGDLERVLSDAKARGIPTSWAQTGVVVATPDEAARSRRINALAGMLKDYDSEVIGGRVKGERLKAHLPIPQAAVDFHAAMDEKLLAELLALIDQIPDHPMSLLGERTAATLGTEIDQERRTVRLLSERVLLAPRPDLVAETRRLLRFCQAMEKRSLIEAMVHCSLVAIATERIAGRIVELKAEMPELPALLDGVDARLSRIVEDLLVGEFLISWHSVTDMAETTTLMGPHRSSWDRIGFAAMVRVGRESLLSSWLSWTDAARRHRTPIDQARFAADLQADHVALHPWDPRTALLRMTMGAMPALLRSIVAVRLRVQVLAAELRGSPWPVDAFAPAGGALRRIQRDGVLIGAYTVYEDGVDDGGNKKKDRCFTLYGPLEPPTPPTMP